MAYIANQQRKTYENSVGGGRSYTVATFQINKYNRGGGQNPYSLFKIQANWNSGSLVVNSELYVMQSIYDYFGSPYFNYMPDGKNPDDNKFPIYAELLPPYVQNRVKYSHLLSSDNANINDYFYISFENIRTDPNDSVYYLIDVDVNTPAYDGGKLIADSYCYILNTI